MRRARRQAATCGDNRTTNSALAIPPNSIACHSISILGLKRTYNCAAVPARFASCSFNLIYVLVIVRLARRELVWINVTSHPTAEWIAQQITEAFPWSEAPRYLIRDQDGIYGAAVARRLRAMGIRDKPIAPGSPWQNAFAERLIGIDPT